MLNLIGKEIQKVDTFALDVAFSVPHPSHFFGKPNIRKNRINFLESLCLPCKLWATAAVSLLVANAISSSNSMGLPATFFLVIG